MAVRIHLRFRLNTETIMKIHSSDLTEKNYFKNKFLVVFKQSQVRNWLRNEKMSQMILGTKIKSKPLLSYQFRNQSKSDIFYQA